MCLKTTIEKEKLKQTYQVTIDKTVYTTAIKSLKWNDERKKSPHPRSMYACPRRSLQTSEKNDNENF